MHHLPIHPFTGQQAVYVTKNGTPRYPIRGASDDGDAGDSGDSGDQGDADGGADDGGDDSGDDEDWQAKFSAQRKINRKLERDAKPLLEILKESGLTAGQAVELIRKSASGDGSGDDVDADAIRQEAQREADAKANARIVRAEVRALAAESFANPADALHNLDLDEYEVNEDGELDDPEAVKKALADVLRKNPHYAKKGKGPKPDPSQGPRGGTKPEATPGIGRLRAAYAESAK